MYNQPAVTNHQNTDILSGNGTAVPVPPSTLACILSSLQHPSTRIGYAFHIMAEDKLSRRGIVLDDRPDTYIVQFVDVEHSNAVYDKLFGVQKITHQVV